MKSKFYKVWILALALFLSAPLVLAQKSGKDFDKDSDKDEEQEQEPQRMRAMATDPAVVITMCLESGNITINGGDRREVRVATDSSAQVTMRRSDETVTVLGLGRANGKGRRQSR